MPRIHPSEYTVCPVADDALLVLRRVELVEPDESSPYQSGPRLKWMFETVDLIDDDSGEGYRASIYTGTAYGNSKANLTKLLDRLCPDLNGSEKARLDTDELCGKRFRANVIHEKKQDGSSRAVLDGIRPARRGAQNAPTVQAEVNAPELTVEQAHAKCKEIAAHLGWTGKLTDLRNAALNEAKCDVRGTEADWKRAAALRVDTWNAVHAKLSGATEDGEPELDGPDPFADE